MRIPLLGLKPRYGQNRTINTLLKMGVLGILVIFGLLLGNWVFAMMFNDDIESYQLGDLKGQGYWSDYTAVEYDVVDTKPRNGIKSIFRASADTERVALTNDFGYNGIDEQSFYVWIEEIVSNGYFRDEITNWTGTEEITAVCRIALIVGEYLGQIWKKDTSEWITFTPDLSSLINTKWFYFKHEWSISDGEKQHRCQIDNNVSNWVPLTETTTTTSVKSRLTLRTRNVRFWADDFGEIEPEESFLTIITPPTGTATTSPFTTIIDYDKKEEDWQKIMLIYEDWHASSTCPVYGTSEWWDEYNAGYFNEQSPPFFSPFLTDEASTTQIYVSDLPVSTYRCVRCYFINEDTITMSDEKCQGYTLTISAYTPTTPQLPVSTWQQYYGQHSDEKFATPTAIFTTIAGIVDYVISRTGGFLMDFRLIFNTTQAQTKGNELGNVIPQARGYLTAIDSFFGGLPVSMLFVYAILIMIIVSLYRLMKAILQLIRG